MLKYHHTAYKRGYVSRRNPDGIRRPYTGRFGTGYTVERPCWHSTQYCFIEYWIEEEVRTMKYIVENWFTEEILKVFSSEEAREKWLADNVNFNQDGGYLADGTKISIYEAASSDC